MNYREKTEKGYKARKKTLSVRHIKIYEEGAMAMRALSGLEHELFLWLASTSDEGGQVYSNEATRAAFVAHTGRYADQTVKGAMASLKRKGFLVGRQRGVLWVNPAYAWHGAEEDRARALELALAGTYDKLKVKVER